MCTFLRKEAAGPLFFAGLTPKVSSEAPSRTFFDRLDIKSDAIDLINTLVTFNLCCLPPGHPINHIYAKCFFFKKKTPY